MKTKILQPQPNISWTEMTARVFKENCNGRVRVGKHCGLSAGLPEMMHLFWLAKQFLWLSARSRISKVVHPKTQTSPRSIEAGFSEGTYSASSEMQNCWQPVTWVGGWVNAWAKLGEKEHAFFFFLLQGWVPWKPVGFLPQTSAEPGLHLCGFSSQFIDLTPCPWWVPGTTAARIDVECYEENIPHGSLTSLFGHRYWQSIGVL